MHLVETIKFLIDKIINDQYPNISFSDIFAIYLWATPMWRDYDPEYDMVIEKIIENYDHIKSMEVDRGLNKLYIYYEDSEQKKIELYIPSSPSSFLEDISMYTKNGRCLHKLYKGRPSRRMMIKFLDKFHRHIRIKNGKIEFNPMTKEYIDSFFDFNKEDDDE